MVDSIISNSNLLIYRVGPPLPIVKMTATSRRVAMSWSKEGVHLHTDHITDYSNPFLGLSRQSL